MSHVVPAIDSHPIYKRVLFSDHLAILYSIFLRTKMSNTFDGVLREFPYIGVDRFNTSASVFLLTHCHADHLDGISNKSFSGIVYCSKETKKLLALDSRLKNSLKLVKELPYNTRTRLETPYDVKNAVYITLIDAYHCLGACMFLIEEVENHVDGSQDTQDSDFDLFQVSRAVLCTGDLRAETWWCESIRQTPVLFPYIFGSKPLDCIYFDSTFAYRQEPYIEIPPNNHGILEAISMLRQYPKNDPEIDFEFVDTTLGFEQAWAFVLNYFSGHLSVKSPHLERKLRLVAECDRINGKILSRAMEQPLTRGKRPIFHAGMPLDASLIVVRIKQCINFNIRDYTGICCPISLDSIPSTVDLQFIKCTKLGNKLYEFLDRYWILPANGKELLPLEIKLLFSRHSSYSEVKDFLSMFKPRQVFPCFYSQKVWQGGFTMARVFGELCSDNEFNFDKNMSLEYSLPLKEILDRPVATINRWNIDDCDKEQKFIEDIMEQKRRELLDMPREGPALIKLRKVVRVPFLKTERSTEDYDFLRRRNKDFSLQKVSEGRRNVNYENFVKEQQTLYYKKHNLPQYKRDYHSPKYSREFTSALGGSSDYDTDSCESSFDLLERSRKLALPSDSTHDRSFIQESQQGLFWKVHKLSPRNHSLNQRSFIKSSFDSFEENRFPRRLAGRLKNNIYYELEGRIDSEMIDELSMNFAKSPQAWNDMQLSCIT